MRLAIARWMTVIGSTYALGGCYQGLEETESGQFSGGGSFSGSSDGSGGESDSGPGMTSSDSDGSGGETGGGSGDPDPTASGSGSGGSTSGSGGSDGSGTSGDPTGDPTGDSTGDPTGGDPESGTYADGIDLVGLEVNQGSALTLAAGGQTVPPNGRDLQVVPGRPALVRAIYDASGASGMIEGRLTLQHSDGRTEVVIAEHSVSGSSDLSRLGGTFEWKLAGEQVTPGLQYSVGLFEPNSPDAPAPADPPRIPTSGVDDFGVPEGPMELELVIVDAGGGLPAQAREIAEQFFLEMVPIANLKLSYHPETLSSNGADQCLNRLIDLRSSDNPGPHVYYLGIAGGGGGGGVSGLADDTPWSEDSRASCTEVIGGSWMETMLNFGLHEVGHAMGSEHTSGCGAGGTIDPPSEFVVGGRARIMTQGYGITDDALYETGLDDIMNYCIPQWVSQFTFENWRVRASVVSRFRRPRGIDDEIAGVPHYRQETLRGLVSRDGLISWSIATHTVAPSYAALPDGGSQVITADGDELEGSVYEAPLSHGASMIFAPLPAKAEQLDTIEVDALGSHFEFDQPLSLRARYDGFVRRRLERERTDR